MKVKVCPMPLVINQFDNDGVKDKMSFLTFILIGLEINPFLIWKLNFTHSYAYTNVINRKRNEIIDHMPFRSILIGQHSIDKVTPRPQKYYLWIMTIPLQRRRPLRKPETFCSRFPSKISSVANRSKEFIGGNAGENHHPCRFDHVRDRCYRRLWYLLDCR